MEEAVWDGRTGVVVDSHDPKVLAEAVERVLTDKSFHTITQEHGSHFIRALSELPAFPVEQADHFFVTLREA